VIGESGALGAFATRSRFAGLKKGGSASPEDDGERIAEGARN